MYAIGILNCSYLNCPSLTQWKDKFLLNSSMCMLYIIWSATWQNQQSDCAPSEDSDQPGHPPSLIRVFIVCMKKAWILSYPLSAQQRLWSDWADAQADLSLRWAHSHFVDFVKLYGFRNKGLSQYQKPVYISNCSPMAAIQLSNLSVRYELKNKLLLYSNMCMLYTICCFGWWIS